MLLGSLNFPQIGELVDWKAFGPGGFNKTVLIVLLSGFLTVLFFLGGRKKALVPTGVQNAAEAMVDFISGQIILQTMGEDGLGDHGRFRVPRHGLAASRARILAS